MALWGGGFSEKTRESVVEFTESVSYDRRLWPYDIEGSKAHAAMLAETGIIPKNSADAIISELDKIAKKIKSGSFEFSSALEDIHMHIESALIKALGDDGARVHTARSRNDQVNLDFRMWMRDEIVKIRAGITAFQISLVEKASAEAATLIPGFTHLQHAQPVTLGHHLLAYVSMFERDKGRLADCYKRVDVMPLGSGAIAGTTLPIDRDFVRRKLGFASLSRNSMDAVADRDFACEFLSALSIFAMHVSRLSEDIIIWKSQEFDFIDIADGFCTGSSLMPQKKNPDVAELARGKTGRVFGALVALLTLCKGLPLTYNRDLQEDKEQVFDAADTVAGILEVFPPMIDSITVNRKKAAAAASEPGLMATDLAERLVEDGVPFRKAHHLVGALVRRAKELGVGIDSMPADELKSLIPSAAAEDLRFILRPAASVRRRDLPGGTAPARVRKEIKHWKKLLSKEKNQQEE